MLDVTVLFGGYLWPAAPGADLVTDRIAVIALVGQHDFGVGLVFCHQIGESRAVMGVARRQQKRDWKTLSVGPGMDLVENPPRERPRAWF